MAYDTTSPHASRRRELLERPAGGPDRKLRLARTGSVGHRRSVGDRHGLAEDERQGDGLARVEAAGR